MVRETEPPEPDVTSIRSVLTAKRPLLRIVAWGGAAAIALAVVAVATQTETGTERLQVALALQPRQPVAVAAIPQPDGDTAALAREAQQRLDAQLRLEAQVRTLAADRDRLAARLASLEKSLDEVTGSIRKQATQQATLPPSKPPELSAPQTQVATAGPAPTPAPPKIETSAAIPAPPAADKTDTPKNAEAPPSGTPIAEPVPLPPVRVATLPPPQPAERKTPEIGVDIGGAPNIEVLNLRWIAVKANFGPLLGGLHPLVARVHRQGASDVRLLVGPLPTMAAATQLCSRFSAARVTCRPVKFEGEQFVQH